MKNVYNQVENVKSEVLSFDSIVNIKEAKNNLPNHLIMGNVSTYALEFGTEEKIETLTKQCLSQKADIISPACGLGMKSPLGNIQMILKTVKRGVGNSISEN